MRASVSPGTPGDPSGGASGGTRSGDSVASRAEIIVTTAGHTILSSAGLAAGVLGGVAAGWLSWMWQAGGVTAALAIVTVLLVLGALFAGCRAAGWSMGSRLGAGLPAAGWTLGGLLLIAVSPAGDIVLTSTFVDYAYLFGGLTAVTLATMLTGPR